MNEIEFADVVVAFLLELDFVSFVNLNSTV